MVYAHKVLNGILYQKCGLDRMFIYSNKRAVKKEELFEGNIIRVGFPSMHSVYRVSKEGVLSFQYHYHEGQGG